MRNRGNKDDERADGIIPFYASIVVVVIIPLLLLAGHQHFPPHSEGTTTLTRDQRQEEAAHEERRQALRDEYGIGTNGVYGGTIPRIGRVVLRLLGGEGS